MLVQISGFTNIWILSVRYFAISKLFPHHLNVFDNVPINYGSGALVNVTTASTGPKTYTNIINYTAHATALAYTYRLFSLPLTNCKVIPFITTLFVTGSLLAPVYYPLDLRITATILTTNTYQFSVTYGIKTTLTRLHFSLIIFDQVDV